MGKAIQLQRELEVMGGGPYLHAIKRTSDLKALPINVLKALELQLKKDLEEIDKVIHVCLQANHEKLFRKTIKVVKKKDIYSLRG